MRIRDADSWQKYRDANPPPSVGSDPVSWPEQMSEEDMGRGYGFVVILAAERWADEMERRLDDDPTVTVASIACSVFSPVNQRLGRWGLTVFQYGYAVSLLARVWEHGEALRRWYNLQTQIGDEGERANTEGGVLKPRLLQWRLEDH